MNTEVYRKIEKYCKKYKMFQKGDRVVVGLSGGADSVFLSRVLLKMREEYALSLAFLHVNHGIRGEEAQRDENFCRTFAKIFDVPFVVFRENIPQYAKEHGMTEEEAGRVFRYQCLQDFCKINNYQKIAVAHHRDDQAETVLFQMLRGSSVRGMGGIRPVRENIVRPLLETSREEILQQLKLCGQSWCEDSTNETLEYARNQIRQQVLPYLEQKVVTGSSRHLARLAGQMQEVYDFIAAETDKIYMSDAVCLYEDKIFVKTEELMRAPQILQREIMLRCIEELSGSRKDIASVHLEQLCGLVVAETGKKISLPYDLVAEKEYQRLCLRKEETVYAEENSRFSIDALKIGEQRSFSLMDRMDKKEIITFQKESMVKKMEESDGKIPKNSCIKWFDYDKISGMLELRHPQQGDFFQMDLSGRIKKLNRFFIDEHIAASERKKIWVFAQGNHILWIPECGRVSAAFYVSEETEHVLCAEYHVEKVG